mmetsp:Transcript_41087/g.82669  ORF Transcript_41087/g.82669 Transcript_41087/m.82669 type:complete len:205 (-) Transcript_41087:173-787(-)
MHRGQSGARAARGSDPRRLQHVGRAPQGPPPLRHKLPAFQGVVVVAQGPQLLGAHHVLQPRSHTLPRHEPRQLPLQSRRGACRDAAGGGAAAALPRALPPPHRPRHPVHLLRRRVPGAGQEGGGRRGAADADGEPGHSGGRARALRHDCGADPDPARARVPGAGMAADALPPEQRARVCAHVVDEQGRGDRGGQLAQRPLPPRG